MDSEKVVVLTAEDPAVTRLKDLHSSITTAVQSAVEYAIESGEILTRIRATFPKRAPKGEGFGEWVDKNLPYTKMYAYAYIRAYDNRAQWLANPTATVRQLLGIGDGKGKQAREQNESPVLTKAQERRAVSISKGVGCSIERARIFVLSQARKPVAKDTTKDPKHAGVIKRTVRYDSEIDDMIVTVATRTERSYSVVANELSTIGKTRFRNRYAEYLGKTV